MILALFVFWIASPSLFATESSFKALLVSIEKYDLAPLAFAGQDIEKFSVVLMARYGCETQSCINNAALSTESGEDLPMRSVMRKIEEWCKKLSNDDSAVLYLAGHGVKDGGGKLYLAMTNFNRNNFDTAAIPLEWIRDQFGKCNGKSKLLLIDTCFAGTSRNIDFEQATSGEISGAFADLSNVSTIASCREDEKSWLWMEMKHSLFTYWLIEAFKGHADLNGDRVLTFNELVQYLNNNVPWAAQVALDKPQHPAVLNAAAGKNFNLPLHAVDLTQLIDDVAEQIDLQMRMEKFAQIGVPVFTSGPDKTFDPRYGTLPSWASDQLRNILAKKTRTNRSGYKVVSENALRETLASKGITPDDLGTEKTKNLKIGGTEIPLLVDGQMTLFGKAGVSLRTNLLDTQGKSDVGQAGGAAMLSVTEIGMTDASGKFSISSSSPPQRRDTFVSEPGVGLVSPRRIEDANQIRREQENPHPMTDASLPFKVWFEIRPLNRLNASYQKREVQINGNNCYLPLSRGEEYRIMVENNTGNEVFARILVDGLNTLSQRETTQAKGAYVEASDPESEGDYVIAPRAALTDARAWAMPSRGPYAIQGFYDANNKNDTLRRFQIVDADQSAAAHKNYTEQLGLITIGFFRAESKTTRGIGTSMGRAERARIASYQGGMVPGETMAVYNIRYMTPETLRKTVAK